MTQRKRLAFAAAAAVLALASVWAAGELVMRAVASRTLIYNIEMVRYAKLLKTVDPDGLNSHAHRPGARATLMGVDVSLNSQGHRGGEPEPASPGGKRVLVLGSSVTMGWGVPEREVFTALVEERFRRERPLRGAAGLRLLNAGIGNYDTLAQLNLLRSQFPKIKPDAVVLHYFIGDARPRAAAKNNPILKHSYLAAYFFGRALFAARAAGARDLAAELAELYDGEAWARTRERIAEMRALAAAGGAPFLVMIIPDLQDLRPEAPYARLYARIERDLAAMGIDAVNVFPAFSERYAGAERRVWVQADDSHPNAAGHALMAEALYRHLAERDPLKLGRRAP